jgi:anhydro-N-acetylmuramic acid kinase
MSILKAIGLMSGTSLDGVDVALVESDGERIERLGPTGYRAYTPTEQDLLRRALAEAVILKDRKARPGSLRDAEAMITQSHAETVEDFISKNKIIKKEIALVGFHGQTVLHRPREHLTVQIGDGPCLAKKLAIPVVYDFRAADIAAGGEGAPLVPIYHWALANKLKSSPPLAIVNIGGVANITYLDGDNDPLAFDTGPGNAPIDDLVRKRTGQKHDFQGKVAARGNVDEKTVIKALVDPYFAQKPPKSLDRATFATFPLDFLSIENAVATITAIVAGSIVKAFDHLPKKPTSVIVVGGGSQNRTLMAMLQQRTDIPIKSGNDIGWHADAIEAQAFGYLAVRSVKGLPLTFPTTTGVKIPLMGGVLTKP